MSVSSRGTVYILVFVGLLLIALPPNLYATHIINTFVPVHINKTIPSLSNKEKLFRHYYSCRDADTHYPINCNVEYWLRGVEEPADKPINSGYHSGPHTSTRPRTYAISGTEKPLVANPDSNSDKFIVETVTMPNYVQIKNKIDWPKPKVSGKLYNDAFIVPPYNYSCSYQCFDYYTKWYRYYYNVGYQGFTKLPDSDLSGSYKKVRNEGPHFFDDAYWGKPSTVEALKLIGENYYVLTGTLLRASLLIDKNSV